MPRAVREPIQAYLTAAEREDLDRAARELGVSRSEALRRGIRSLVRGRASGALADLAEEGIVSPATAPATSPPRSAPVAPLDALLAEIDADRDER